MLHSDILKFNSRQKWLECRLGFSGQNVLSFSQADLSKSRCRKAFAVLHRTGMSINTGPAFSLNSSGAACSWLDRCVNLPCTAQHRGLKAKFSNLGKHVFSGAPVVHNDWAIPLEYPKDKRFEHCQPIRHWLRHASCLLNFLFGAYCLAWGPL